MHPILNVALRAARKAAQNITQRFDRLDLIKVEEKSHNDYVTQVDHQIEQLLIEIIFQNYPTHSVLGEESGELFGPACQDQQAEYQWIIDPIDGTTNFIFGIPHFAISIAVAKNNQVEHAVIVDPIKREEFTASLGAGAQLNGKRIRVSQRKQLDGALLATGFPFRKNQHAYVDTYLATLKDLMQVTSGIRRAGAASLDLAYVAAGRYDGYWESGLQSWDIAAGALLIQEAGGWVSDFSGKDGFLKSGDVVCGSTRIHPLLLQSISRAQSAQTETKTIEKTAEPASARSDTNSENIHKDSEAPLQNRRERRALDRDRLQAKFIQRQQGKTEKSTETREIREPRREDRFQRAPSTERPRKAPWQSQKSDRAPIPVRSKTDRPPQPRERGEFEDRFSASRRPPRREQARDLPESNEAARGSYHRHDAERPRRSAHTERPEYRSSRPPSGKPRQRTRPD